MANVFADLPVPVGDGVGTTVDTSAFAGRKTVTAVGTFISTLTVEISEDGTDWAPLHSFTSPGKRTLYCAAAYMRVRQSGFILGTASVDVGADRADGQFGTLNVPAADGVGTALDVQTFPELFTVIVAGAFTGSLIIEVSEDGVNYAPALGFSNIGAKNKKMTIAYMRVRRAGTDAALPGTPTVTVGAVDPEVAASSGGDAGIFVFRPGGVAGGNVYTTWASLMTDLVTVEGPKIIEFDNSITSPCTVPAGGPYNMTDVTWQGLEYLNSVTAVFVADGASFTNLYHFRNVYVLSLATSSPMTLANGRRIVIEDFADLSCWSTPFYSGASLTNGHLVRLDVLNHGSIGGSVPNVPVIAMSAATSAQLAAYVGENSTLGRNTITSNAAATVGISLLATSAHCHEQTGIAGTLNLASIGYPRFNRRPARPTAPATANVAAVAWGDELELNATAGSFTQALPAVAPTGATTEWTEAKEIIIKETSGANPIIVDAVGNETIDAPVPVDVVWTNLVNCVASGNDLTKNAGGAAWNAGAISTQVIDQNGYVEWLVGSIAGTLLAGLGHGDTDQSLADVDFGFYMDVSTLSAREFGVQVASFGAILSVGDKLAIRVLDGIVTYWHQPLGGVWTLLYQSLVVPVMPLNADCTLYGEGTTLYDVILWNGEGGAQYLVPASGAVRFVSDGISRARVVGTDLLGLLNRWNTFRKAQGTGQLALADNVAGIAPNLKGSNCFRCNLGAVAGNTRQLGVPTNMLPGFTYLLEFVQPAAPTAVQALTYDATWWKFPAGVIPTLTATNGAKDIITCYYDGDAMQCVFQADFRNP